MKSKLRGVYVGQRAPLAERFWRYVFKGEPHECWLWRGGQNNDGYGVIATGGVPTMTTAHRASWALHNQAIEEGLHVLHRCDTPACVNPAHLFLGTNRDNIMDCVAKGRRHMPDAKGERNGYAKLTDEEVRQIRDLAPVLRHRVIAAAYHISTGYVDRLAIGERRSPPFVKPAASPPEDP